MVRAIDPNSRKPRLRTQLSQADGFLLDEAAALFDLPKAEVVRRLIRASVLASPALAAENSQTIADLAAQLRMVGRNFSHMLNAIQQGRAVGFEDTVAVWSDLHATLMALDDELTDLTMVGGAKLRRAAEFYAPEIPLGTALPKIEAAEIAA